MIFLLDFYIHFVSLLWNISYFRMDLSHLLISCFSRFCPQSNAYSFSFISGLLYYDSFLHDCPKCFPYSPDFQSYSPLSVDEFLGSFNVIHHMHTCMNLTTPTIPEHYASLLPTFATYKRILLKARSLVPTIVDYNEFIPLTSPSIFASSRSGELPIVIDTGASCSITPLRANFIEALSTPDIPSLGSLTSTYTAVFGQLRVKWDIEDFHGKR